MTLISGYYNLGLRALDAAQYGLSVAGDNIANVNTPGFSRRRLELSTGHPRYIKNGEIGSGVVVDSIRRMEDQYLQNAIQLEYGRLGYNNESLRGLREVERTLGPVESNPLLEAYGDFSNAFAALSGDSESVGLRTAAIAAADSLAGEFRSASGRLQELRRLEDQRITGIVDRVNSLAGELQELNDTIRTGESGGTEQSAARDRRDQVLTELHELTGGRAATSRSGEISFHLPNGPSLVTNDNVLSLTTSQASDGSLRISSNGTDITDDLRSGRLGGSLSVRDDEILTRLADLDAAAADLITRANAAHTSGTDLAGNPGGALFEPDPAPASGAAGSIRIATGIDVDTLALSATGAPGDGGIAETLSRLESTAAGALGTRSPRDFLADSFTELGSTIARRDVDERVAQDLVDSLSAERESRVGVSIDEEAIDLLKHQRAYEAAAKFIQVLNQVTEITVNLV